MCVFHFPHARILGLFCVAPENVILWGLWHWLIHYRNSVLDIAHCLSYMRRFGRCRYSRPLAGIILTYFFSCIISDNGPNQTRYLSNTGLVCKPQRDRGYIRKVPGSIANQRSLSILYTVYLKRTGMEIFKPLYNGSHLNGSINKLRVILVPSFLVREQVPWQHLFIVIQYISTGRKHWFPVQQPNKTRLYVCVISNNLLQSTTRESGADTIVWCRWLACVFLVAVGACCNSMLRSLIDYRCRHLLYVPYWKIVHLMLQRRKWLPA